ncbi:hypothetical protein A1F94_010398 [Pyrenophora tritici-repentis]|nr:hypothetical protein A1F94_010398 [Pyrenophora tritici-repentis]
MLIFDFNLSLNLDSNNLPVHLRNYSLLNLFIIPNPKQNPMQQPSPPSLNTRDNETTPGPGRHTAKPTRSQRAAPSPSSRQPWQKTYTPPPHPSPQKNVVPSTGHRAYSKRYGNPDLTVSVSVMSLQCSFELEISRQRQDDRAASAGIEGWECEGFKLRLSIVVGLSLRVISLGFGFAIYKPRP